MFFFPAAFVALQWRCESTLRNIIRLSFSFATSLYSPEKQKVILKGFSASLKDSKLEFGWEVCWKSDQDAYVIKLIIITLRKLSF